MFSRISYSVVFVFFLLSVIIAAPGCGGGDNPSSPSYSRPEAADYSAISWSDAFEAAQIKFSKEYAFTEWKDVDFQNLYETFAPIIAAAEASNDLESYYGAVREYLFSIPDGHITITSRTRLGLATDMIDGGFGLALAELDDGRIIAAAVVDGGPAAIAGVQQGAEILQWNGFAIDDAIGGVSVLWSNEPPATNEHRRLEQIRFLTRAPIGESRNVSFMNPGESEAAAADMTAVDDDKEGLALVNFAPRPADEDILKLVEYRVLDGGYGYVRVYMETDPENDEGYAWAVYEKFEEAVRHFVDLNVPGVIVDLRGNQGGSDQTTADLLGFFYDEAEHYENQFLYNSLTGEFMWVRGNEKNNVIYPLPIPLQITPQDVYYDGPVIALVNPACISSGEGMTMGIKKSRQGRVVGFFGTNGSFGIEGGQIKMPFESDAPISISYPIGRSLDANLVVQLDSGVDGIGGVQPTNRIPRTMENVLAYANGDDVELNFAVDLLQNGNL